MASKKLLSLTKARDEALAAVASAKSEAERVKLLAVFEAAALELGALKASDPSARMEEEKSKKAKSSKSKAKKAEEEEDDDESEKSEEEDDEDCDDEEAEEEEEEGDDEEDDEDEKSESDAEEDAEEAKAFFKSKEGLYTPSRLVRLCQQVTGKKGIREMFGALDALGIRVKSAEKTEKRVAKLETEARSVRVDKMLAQAKREGRITRAQVDNLKVKGMADPKFLKGFLASLPKIVRTTDDGPVMPRMDANGNLVGMPSNSDQEKIMNMALTGLNGEAREKASADLTERHSKKNGSARRF